MSVVKKRARKAKTEEEKIASVVRSLTPSHVVEIEIGVTSSQDWKMLKINKQLRLIRNTVLGQLKKNYDQMIRTKKYKRLTKRYSVILKELRSDKTKERTKFLSEEKKRLAESLEKMKVEFNVTFDYARKYAEQMRKNKYNLPHSVLVWSVCETVWQSIERLMYGNAKKVRFYKKGKFISFQGKQANRCIILKQNKGEDTFFVSFAGTKFPLIVKKNDLFIEETLSNMNLFAQNPKEIEQQNNKRYFRNEMLLSTYRVRNNRIVCKTIRGKRRYFLQVCLEGTPVPKRNKDGSFRHRFGFGRVAADVGTQSAAIISKDQTLLKNLAERSDDAFLLEHKITNISRYLDRSRRAMNSGNFDEVGRVKKGSKVWIASNRYKKESNKLRELHRKAAANRKYAHNEDINLLRSMGDEFVTEQMNFKSLQKKAKESTVNEKTGRFNKRKRFGKSILRRSPGYFLSKAKEVFERTGGTYREVNTWSFKASQYDHVLDDTNKKQLSARWHQLPEGAKIQRDLYSAFLLFCSNEDFTKPNKKMCDHHFDSFLTLHNRCIETIKNNRKVVLNSGIKF